MFGTGCEPKIVDIKKEKQKVKNNNFDEKIVSSFTTITAKKITRP